MFTGLIEETGKIVAINNQNQSKILTIQANQILDEVKIGDSIAINGVCETVLDYNKSTFNVFVSSETLSVTNFKDLKCGMLVNLERAMRLSDRLNGHIVTGHVDVVSQLIRKNTIGNTTELFFTLPA